MITKEFQTNPLKKNILKLMGDFMIPLPLNDGSHNVKLYLLRGFRTMEKSNFDRFLKRYLDDRVSEEEKTKIVPEVCVSPVI